MPHMLLRPILLSMALVLATTLGASAKPPKAKPTPQPKPAPAINFDGRWSVVIITDAGACDAPTATACASPAAASGTRAILPR